jgi:hypothetical protein
MVTFARREDGVADGFVMLTVGRGRGTVMFTTEEVAETPAAAPRR